MTNQKTVTVYKKQKGFKFNETLFFIDVISRINPSSEFSKPDQDKFHQDQIALVCLLQK